jgi:hypothetical protein
MILAGALPLRDVCANGGATIGCPAGEGPMADHSEVAYTTADGNDYPAHEQTYLGFLTLVKWSTLTLAAILLLMFFFLV